MSLLTSNELFDCCFSLYKSRYHSAVFLPIDLFLGLKCHRIRTTYFVLNRIKHNKVYRQSKVTYQINVLESSHRENLIANWIAEIKGHLLQEMFLIRSWIRLAILVRQRRNNPVITSSFQMNDHSATDWMIVKFTIAEK